MGDIRDLIVILSDKWATLSLLVLNLTIAAFLLTETDLVGALVKTALGIASPVIVLLAIARTKQPRPRFGVPALMRSAAGPDAILPRSLFNAIAISVRADH